MRSDQNHNKRNNPWETALVVAGMLALFSVLLAEMALAQPSAAVFSSISIAPGEDQFTISGLLSDQENSEPIVAQQVEAYCDGKKALIALTDEQGRLEFIGKYNECALSSNVLLSTSYNDNDYSLAITMPGFVFMGKKLGGNDAAGQESENTLPSNTELFSARQTVATVPEYSTFTLALAIIVSGLGLALLRKQP